MLAASSWEVSTAKVAGAITGLVAGITALLVAVHNLRQLGPRKSKSGNKRRPVRTEITEVRSDVYELGRLFGEHLYETTSPIPTDPLDDQEDARE